MRDHSTSIASSRARWWRSACECRAAATGWTLELIATRPEHRPRGRTAALLRRALERGRARGLKQADITVLIGNEAAERLYARAGFHVLAEQRDLGFEAIAGAPGLRRYVAAL